jgi:hypothetical protein
MALEQSPEDRHVVVSDREADMVDRPELVLAIRKA